MTPFLTVFIPAFNEDKNLGNSVQIIRSKMLEMGVNDEILIIDDGSTDNTGTIAEQLATEYERVLVRHHQSNQGVGAAFLTARDLANGFWMIFIPADLALDPNEISNYLQASDSADIVVGLRSDRSDYTWARKVISWTNIHLIKWLFDMKEHQFQYISMYNLELLRQIEIEYWNSAFFLAEILIKSKALGARLVEVEIRYAPRVSGKATGAKFRLLIFSVRDLFHFWMRWVFQDHESIARRRSFTGARF